MSALRRQVFIEKVKKKLFPNVPSSQEEETPQTLALETSFKNINSETVQQKDVRFLMDGDIKIQPEQRLYTVSLPPEGYVPCLPEPNSCTNSEEVSSGDDAEVLNLHDHLKRRIRKHKSKKRLKHPNDGIEEQAELEKHQNLLLKELQPQCTFGHTLSKNKKRKLKKKQQLRRKKAAGLVTKASGVSFMYQPEESSSEQEDVEGTARQGAQDTLEVGPEYPSEEGIVLDTIQEDLELANSKAEGILSFLKATQETYFYDGVSKHSDPAVCMETAKELLGYLESHSLSPSDVFILDHMKTLLLLRDIEKLKKALEKFQEHCMMPPDHSQVISAFFNYWITYILPEKNTQ